MAQTFYGITPIEVTPGTQGSWQDVDVSASVPSGATGVIIHIVHNTPAGMDYQVGLRKNGSTDNRLSDIKEDKHCWAAIGIDANRVFECYVESASVIDIWLVGYTGAGVTFLTNGVDKSLSALDAWTDIDCSAQAPSATGLIFEFFQTSAADTPNVGMRKNGSTDNRVVWMNDHNTFGIIIGCDTAQVCEGYINDVSGDFYLVGYITDGASFNTNATDITKTADFNTWTDLTALPANSVMGFIEVTSAPLVVDFGLRKNGSTGSGNTIVADANRHPWAFVECDTGGIIEGRHHTNISLFVVGYATGAGVFIPKIFYF